MEICARKRKVAAAVYDPVVRLLCLGQTRLEAQDEGG